MSKKKNTPAPVSNIKSIPGSAVCLKKVPTDNIGQYYSQKPSWCFSLCDNDFWSFCPETASDDFWDDILPRMKAFETQTWSEILVKGKKQNHPIDVSDLNKIARDRLEKLYIEQESIISLRLNGDHRLYGLMGEGSVFHILWYDTEHGDNDTCVCRSHKRHT